MAPGVLMITNAKAAIGASDEALRLIRCYLRKIVHGKIAMLAEADLVVAFH